VALEYGVDHRRPYRLEETERLPGEAGEQVSRAPDSEVLGVLDPPNGE
jgi:hypothetical protein